MSPETYLVSDVAGVVATVLLFPILEDLKNDGRNTDNVLTYGMGYNANRYSTLKQINKRNVKRLVPVWNVSLGSNYGEQAQPLVYDGVMFVTNAEYTVAIDIATGKQLWRTAVEWPCDAGVLLLYPTKCLRSTRKVPRHSGRALARSPKTGNPLKQKSPLAGRSPSRARRVANGVLTPASVPVRHSRIPRRPGSGDCAVWRRYTYPRGREGSEPACGGLSRGGGSLDTGSRPDLPCLLGHGHAP